MKKAFNKKSALAIVALILVALTAVSVTYGWIDDVKLVEFDNDNLAQNGAPLKSGVDINSTVNITENNSEINLGNMLTNDDLTYEYTDGEATRRHTKYDGSDDSKKPDWEDIDENKGYFYQSGDMHLSPCYSDGHTFYFPKNSSNNSFREGNKDDENVNYISITLKVSSPDANVDFWFRNEPSIYTKGTTTRLTGQARYAINVDGQSHIYSSSGTANTCNAALTGTQELGGVRKTSVYTYNHKDNTTAERGKNSNTLFSIKKGDTVNLNIKIWLEPGFDVNNTAVDVNFQLVSSWAYSRIINIVDKTTGPQGTSWIGNDSAKLFLVLPQFLEELDSDPAHWYNLRENAPIYALTAGSTAGTYSVSLPLVYNNEEMMIYRCNDTGWNDSGSDASARSSYNVHCWNWWGTYTPNTYKEESYTLYGSSLDESANNCFKFSVDGNNNPLPKAQLTNKGYGTWGGVELISVYSHYDNVDYVPKRDGGNNIQKLFVRDYSDYDTSGEVYIYEMSRLSSVDVNNDGKIDADDDSGITGNDPWKTYVPKSSSRLQFDAFTSGNSRFGVWGYQSWYENNNGNITYNPQRRPLASTGLYSENSTVYHIAQNYGTDKGWGYWNDANTVYLIKSSFLSDNSISAHAYMFNDTSYKQAYPGEALTRLTDASGNNVSYTWNGGNYTAQVWKTGSPCVYNKIVFNNGDSNGGGVDQIGKKKTGDLNLFPGCFYQADGSKWLGSLTDAGREATVDTGGSDSGGGDDPGDGTLDGYTVDSGFTFKINDVTYTVYQNAAGNEFKVRIPLAAGANWTTVQKNGRDYGLEQSSQSYNVPGSNVNIYLTNVHSNNISLYASSAGNYIATFTYDNGNTGTIKISSVLKES